MQAVKLEGGEDMAPTIHRISQAGIPVVAHIGLTPQRQNSLGGFRVQGKTASAALKLMRDALAVQEAGALMVVLEAMPAEIASVVTRKLRIPTIGIGAGHACSGQVLVQADMTGNFPPGRFLPRFVKTYADVWGEASRGIERYRHEVKNGVFPSSDYTYAVSPDAVAEFKQAVGDTSEGENER